MLGTIIGAIIVGAIIGALGRLLLPGKQNISLVVTILIGIVANLIVGWGLYFLFGYNNNNGGICVGSGSSSAPSSLRSSSSSTAG